MPKTIVLIPARYQSSRFPGKPLAKLKGKSLIRWVYESVVCDDYDTFVVTDDDRIESHVKEFGRVLRVNDDVPSGSERIALALDRFFKDRNVDLVINVQGDEPLIKKEILKDIINAHSKSDKDIYTVVKKRLRSEQDWSNANVVKAAYSEVTGSCPYFSRASIPFDRDGEQLHWYQHIGIYSYKTEALIRFAKSPMGLLERIEKLEQLRALELDMKIGAIETDFKLIGVDCPEDINRVEEVMV